MPYRNRSPMRRRLAPGCRNVKSIPDLNFVKKMEFVKTSKSLSNIPTGPRYLS